MKILIRANDSDSYNIDFEVVFKRLNEELSKIEQSLELICAGGYVLQLHGYKATVDVDAFFITNDKINKAIEIVGNEFSINRPDELWLNNSISNLNKKPKAEHYNPVHQFSNLTVNAVDIVYVIGMKLISGREQDVKDIMRV